MCIVTKNNHICLSICDNICQAIYTLSLYNYDIFSQIILIMEFCEKLQTPIRYAEYSRGITTLGPYFKDLPRVALWVQGCRLKCPECISPEWRDFQGGILSTVGQVIANIFPNLDTTHYSGISISGGEPLEQAEGLCDMLEVLHYLNPDFHVITYTGKSMAEIEQMPLFPRLSQVTNILVTEPYIAALNDGKYGLMGSSNQIIYANIAKKWIIRNTVQPEQFSHPLDNYPYESVRRTVQFTTNTHDNQGLLMVGIPPKGLLDAFKSI